MNHHERHHLEHVKEREREYKERLQYERDADKHQLPIHPVWLFVIGTVLVLLAVLVWTLL